MSESKFNKFAVNYLEEKKETVYSYTAYNEASDSVLIIRPRADFDVPIPAAIQGTCAGNFQTEHSTEITAKQFWGVYKSYTLLLFQYYQEQNAALETV
jgi:hypothetical protein